ncbi:MAG: phage tail protein [Alphaproteobacteria bacterium]
MASIVLSAAGNAVLPGVGGILGKLAGGAIDRQFGFGARKSEGPRLENLKVQDSRYGAGIPIIYGRARIAGQVIWSSDLIETVHEEDAGGKGGTGGASSRRYSYSVNCAVAIGKGPIGQITAAWADGKQIYDGLNWKAGLAASVNFYPGDQMQNPDPVMEAALGAGNVPAYRGTAVIVFENMQLADFGSRLPNLSFEVTAGSASAAPLAAENVVPDLQNTQTGLATHGGTPPLVISGDARRANQAIVAGMRNATAAGSDAAFIVTTCALGDEAPGELARVVSADFSIDAIVGVVSWSLSPDGRYAAIIALTDMVPNTLVSLAIYDTQARQFGPVAQVTMKNFVKSVAWLDALRFVVSDHDGSQLGVQIFARAGLTIVSLGFRGVWGAGSAGSRATVGTAQFILLQGGLLYCAGNTWISPSTLYLCHMRWGAGGLVCGAPYTLSASVPANSLNHADIIPIGPGEFLFCFAKTDRVHVMSFMPTASGVVVTRNWQVVTLAAISTYVSPCRFGGHILLLQKSIFDGQYRLSEIALGAGSFTLATDSVPVEGGEAFGSTHFMPMVIDYNRILIQGGDSFGLDFSELRIISRYAGGDSLQNIVADILAQAGYAPGDSALDVLAPIRVTGYVLQPPLTARAALEPLRLYGAFDLIESDDRLKAVARHGDIDAALEDGELGAAKDASRAPPPLTITRKQELDLPLEISVDYIDPARDFEIGSVRSRRIASAATARGKLAMPVICSADRAKQIAEARLYAAWAEREQARMTLSRRYLFLDPGDVVQAGQRSFRLTSVHQSGGLMQCDAINNYAPANASAAKADIGNINAPAREAADSILYLMDLPPLNASDQPGIYAAVSAAPGWRGGSLWRAGDGVTYASVDSFQVAATAGMALTALAAQAADYMDRVGSVDVQLIRGTLASCGDPELLNGANAALLGGEIIQFRTATLLGPGYYRLTDFLRGRRGTEDAIAAHQVGENFIMLNSAAMHLLPLRAEDRGRGYQYRALTAGQSLGGVLDTNFTSDLRIWRPLSPAQLQGARASGTGSDLALGWVRRARLNAEWTDLIDVPLDEAQELYDLEIYDSGDILKRAVSGLTAASYVYTAAQQSADFAIVPASYRVRVYQVSPRYGRGAAALGVI